MSAYPCSLRVIGQDNRRPPVRDDMRRDESGVGGFVEDLPVLVFVLVGVLALVSTSVWVAQERTDAQTALRSEALAEGLLDAVLLRFSDGVDCSISVHELRSLNASMVDSLAPRGFDWMISILILHPWVESIEVGDEGCAFGSTPSGYANRMINAEYGAGGCALVEVRCVVSPA